MMVQFLSLLGELKESQRIVVSMLQTVLRRFDANDDEQAIPADVSLPLRSLDELNSFEEKASETAFFDAMVSLFIFKCLTINNLLPMP